jgi:hypothetical protein
VHSHTVCEFRSPAVRGAVASTAFFVPGSVVSICDSPAFSATGANEVSDANPDGLGCARGLRTAFLLEVGMFVLAYGIWHLWHLAH